VTSPRRPNMRRADKPSPSTHRSSTGCT